MPSLLQTCVETQFASRPARGAYKPRQGATETPLFDIINIRRDTAKTDLKEEIHKLVRSQPRPLPSLLLYDEKGLQIFEKVDLTSALSAKATAC